MRPGPDESASVVAQSQSPAMCGVQSEVHHFHHTLDSHPPQTYDLAAPSNAPSNASADGTETVRQSQLHHTPTMSMYVSPGSGQPAHENGYAEDREVPSDGRYPGGPRNMKVHQNQWNTGLFDCFGDFGTCCLACLCPSIVYAKNKQRFEYLELYNASDPEHGGNGCNGDCCCHCMLTPCLCFGWVLQMSTRTGLRVRHKLAGTPFKDCMASCFCSPCEQTQSSRELASEENWMSRRTVSIL